MAFVAPLRKMDFILFSLEIDMISALHLKFQIPLERASTLVLRTHIVRRNCSIYFIYTFLHNRTIFATSQFQKSKVAKTGKTPIDVGRKEKVEREG